MTGKRPRALRRTSSESLIESESLTHETCSPLSEHPKEKLKPTPPKETVPAPPPPRLVIGFNPKPLPQENGNNGVNSSASSKPASSSAPEGARSPVRRSGLESLLSMPRERKVSEGVGLAIVAAMHTTVPQEDLQQQTKANIVDRRNQREHVAIAIKAAEPILSPPPPPKPSSYATAAAPPYQPQIQTQSIPIHAPGSSSGSSWHRSGRPSQHRVPGGAAQQPLTAGAYGQGSRAMLTWLRQVDREGERDTFLLRASSSKSQLADRDAAAAVASPAVHFLDACYFCKRHLADGKDIYMYRGDKAFCSTDCRTQQILLDERHDNCAVAALKTTTGGAPSRRNRVVAAAGTVAAV